MLINKKIFLCFIFLIFSFKTINAYGVGDNQENDSLHKYSFESDNALLSINFQDVSKDFLNTSDFHNLYKKIQNLDNKLNSIKNAKESIKCNIATSLTNIKKIENNVVKIANQAYKLGGLPTSTTFLMFSSMDFNEYAKYINIIDYIAKLQNNLINNLKKQKQGNIDDIQKLEMLEEKFIRYKVTLNNQLLELKKRIDDKNNIKLINKSNNNFNKEFDFNNEFIAKKLDNHNNNNQLTHLPRNTFNQNTNNINNLHFNNSNLNYKFINPFKNFSISSPFGWRSTPLGTIDFNHLGGYMHTGVDYATPCGTFVHSPAYGKVLIARWTNGGGGNTVIIDHGLINNKYIKTIFYHNSYIIASENQNVNQGQVIARSGSTGNSTGCHSHFETWVNGEVVNPLTLY